MLSPPRDRPWGSPDGPWMMEMTWHDLLFAHWPVAVAELRQIVPAALELDLFDGQAFVGVAPFWMSGVRPRNFPAIPGLSTFPELNVRTYVRQGRAVGVYFFSLDAHSRLAVAGARTAFNLPYFRARMSCKRAGDQIEYRSDRAAPKLPPARFAARYRPVGPVFCPQPGTLEHFLTQRYCLLNLDRRGRVRRLDIDHEPWPLQMAQAQTLVNTMAAASRISIPPESPWLHFSRRLKVHAWRPVLCDVD